MKITQNYIYLAIDKNINKPITSSTSFEGLIKNLDVYVEKWLKKEIVFSNAKYPDYYQGYITYKITEDIMLDEVFKIYEIEFLN